MPTAVILLHATPDGGQHFDLLIEQRPPESPASGRTQTQAERAWSPPTLADIANPDERRLLAFRMAKRLDQARLGDALDALRLPDHRARYLAHEGPVPGGRGEVSRAASGRVIDQAGDQARLELAVEWADHGVQRTRSERINDERWRFYVVA